MSLLYYTNENNPVLTCEDNIISPTGGTVIFCDGFPFEFSFFTTDPVDTFQAQFNDPNSGIWTDFSPGTGRQGVNATTSSMGGFNMSAAADGFQYRWEFTFQGQVCATQPITADVQVCNPPIAVNDSTTSALNATTTFNVLVNDTDADNNIDTATLALLPGGVSDTTAEGTWTVGPGVGEITFVPVTGYQGTASHIYEICDTTGICDTATFSIGVDVPAATDKVLPADIHVIVEPNLGVAAANATNVGQYWHSDSTPTEWNPGRFNPAFQHTSPAMPSGSVHRLSILPDPLGSGAEILRTALVDTDAQPGGFGWRTMISHDPFTLVRGNEYWWGIRMRVGDEAGNSDSSLAYQLHDGVAGSGASPFMACYRTGNTMTLSTKYSASTNPGPQQNGLVQAAPNFSFPAPIADYSDFVFNWNVSSSGFFNAWMKTAGGAATQIISYNGPFGFYNQFASLDYATIGVYRWVQPQPHTPNREKWADFGASSIIDPSITCTHLDIFNHVEVRSGWAI